MRNNGTVKVLSAKKECLFSNVRPKLNVNHIVKPCIYFVKFHRNASRVTTD